MADERPTKLSLKDLRAEEREVHPISWPGGKGEVGLMLLRCQEVQEAHFATVDHFKRKVQAQDGMSSLEFFREKERQEVFRMLLQPGSLRPEDRLLKNADELRKDLDLDEVAFFQREHARLVGERLRRLGLLPEAEKDKES